MPFASPQVHAKRVRHVVTENDRVFAAVKAIQEKNIEKLGQLFFESHASMRDDYQVSIPEIDQLIELARKKEQVIGARLTGGGFGGSVVILTQKGQASQIGKSLQAEYHEVTGENATILVGTS